MERREHVASKDDDGGNEYVADKQEMDLLTDKTQVETGLLVPTGGECDAANGGQTGGEEQEELAPGQ